MTTKRPRRHMALGLAIMATGYHAAAWRHPSIPRAAQTDFNYYLEAAQIAERAKFDFLFFADGNAVQTRGQTWDELSHSNFIAGFEPLTLLSAIAVRTSHIGLVATASTSYNEPYHVARKFASLDHLSGGRAGWNIVTSWSPDEARNFNLAQPPAREARYARAQEFVEVVDGLWQSWEADAFTEDKASGIYFDPGKVRVLNHQGTNFKVAGPLNVPRSPQGRPVRIEAGGSPDGQRLAARWAELTFVALQSREQARELRDTLDARLAEHGRPAGDLRIVPGILPIVGRTDEEAREKYEELCGLLTPEFGLSLLRHNYGDLSGYPLDGPAPLLDIQDAAMQGKAQVLQAAVREQGVTVRQLYELMAASRGHRVIVGSAAHVAEELSEWFCEGLVDGYNIAPADLPSGASAFADLVVPRLQQSGLVRSEYEGTTLREHLGLAAV